MPGGGEPRVSGTSLEVGPIVPAGPTSARVMYQEYVPIAVEPHLTGSSTGPTRRHAPGSWLLPCLPELPRDAGDKAEGGPFIECAFLPPGKSGVMPRSLRDVVPHLANMLQLLNGAKLDPFPRLVPGPGSSPDRHREP